MSKMTGSDPKVKGGKKETELGDSWDSRDKSEQLYLECPHGHRSEGVKATLRISKWCNIDESMIDRFIYNAAR